MPTWVRTAVMLVAIMVWAAVVITSLARGILPDAITWGFPGGLWFLMNPVMPKRQVPPAPPPAGPPAGEP